MVDKKSTSKIESRFEVNQILTKVLQGSLRRAKKDQKSDRLFHQRPVVSAMSSKVKANRHIRRNKNILTKAKEQTNKQKQMPNRAALQQLPLCPRTQGYLSLVLCQNGSAIPCN